MNMMACAETNIIDVLLILFVSDIRQKVSKALNLKVRGGKVVHIRKVETFKVSTLSDQEERLDGVSIQLPTPKLMEFQP